MEKNIQEFKNKMLESKDIKQDNIYITKKTQLNTVYKLRLKLLQQKMEKQNLEKQNNQNNISKIDQNEQNLAQ